MNYPTRYVCLSILFISLMSLQGFAQANNVSQRPCTPELGSAVAQADRYCFSFNAGDTLPIVRTFSFTSPSKGTGILTFNGSMSCSNLNGTTSAVVDLVSQIVTNVNATATVSESSGLRHAVRLLPDPSGNSDSFNLASTRAIKFTAADTKTFFFKLTPLRMDAFTRCFVYNAAFTMSFAP